MRDRLAVPDLTRRSMLFDAAMGAVLALYAAAATTDIDGSLKNAIVPLLMAIAVATRRAKPTVMIVAATGSILLQVVTDRVDYIACLALFPVVHAGAAHPNRKVRYGTLAAVAVLTVLAAVTVPRAADSLAEGDPTPPTALQYGGAAAAYLLAAWALGTSSHQRRSVEQARVEGRIADLERRRLLEVVEQEAERTRLARDMHDVVAHALAVVVAQAEGARYTFETSPQSARNALDVIATTARTSLADVRTMLEQLRHSNVDAAFDDRGDQHRRLLDRMRAAGMTIELTETNQADSAPTMTELTAHRLLTEALTNALKYGDLRTPVQVAIDRTSGIALRVVNRVADTASDLGGTGHGLIGVAERARLAGGGATAHADGRGNWIFTAELPHHAGRL